jgi:lipopolysaccharide export system protein LptA
MKKPFFRLLAVLAVLSANGLAWAEKADSKKPMNIESDTLRYDELKQVSIFTGRVVLNKGTIVIRGEQLEVRQDPEGYQYGLVTAESGKRAFFRQKREGVDEFIEGEGETIYYDGKNDTVTFTKKAQLRRYRGTSLADDITGGVIVYENLTDKFNVDGANAPSANAAATPGRVRAMLTPKPEGAASASGPAKAPAAPGGSLRPTVTLPGVSK